MLLSSKDSDWKFLCQWRQAHRISQERSLYHLSCVICHGIYGKLLIIKLLRSFGNHMYHFITRKELRILPFCVFVCLVWVSQCTLINFNRRREFLLCGGSSILYGNRMISFLKDFHYNNRNLSL